MNLTAQPLLTIHPCVGTTVTEIIHLAATLFRRCDSLGEIGGRLETRIAHTERHEDICPRELIQGHAANAMNNFTKRDVIDIAVDETRSRRISQRLAIQALHRLVVTRPTFAQIEVWSETRNMGQQLLDGDRVTASAFH